jgi:hypothetical protein
MSYEEEDTYEEENTCLAAQARMQAAPASEGAQATKATARRRIHASAQATKATASTSASTICVVIPAYKEAGSFSKVLNILACEEEDTCMACRKLLKSTRKYSKVLNIVTFT